MTYIRVDPDELNVVSTQIHSTMNEMDQSVRHAYDQLRGIRDRARGLDDIRNRASDLYRHHVNQMQSGQHVQRHIQESAQRFSENDVSLSSMIRRSATETINTMMRWHVSSDVRGSASSQLLPHVFNAWHTYAADMWNRAQQKTEFDEMEKIIDLIGGFKDFDKTHMGRTFKMLKGFTPDGRTSFGKFLDKFGSFGQLTSSAIIAVNVVDLLSSGYQDAQTGNYTNTLDKATSVVADIATTMIVQGLVKGALSLNPVTGVLVTGAFLAPKILIGIGHLADSMGFEATGQAIRDFGHKIDIEKAIENTVKWGLTEGVNLASRVWENPKQALQDSVNFVQGNVDAVASWSKKLIPGWG